MIRAFIVNPDTGKKVLARVLLDSGANSSLITQKLFKRIGLEGKSFDFSMNVAGGETAHSTQHTAAFQLESVHANEYHCSRSNLGGQENAGGTNGGHFRMTIHGNTIQRIGAQFPPVLVDPQQHNHLRDLKFTENYPIANARTVDVLLGEPYYTHLMLPEQRVQTMFQPSAKQTKLGWVLRGSIGAKNEYKVYSTNADSLLICPDLESFDFSQFWKLEHLGIAGITNQMKRI